MPVLDTNFLIALDDPDDQADTLLAQLGPGVVVPAVVAAEYLTGSGRHAASDLDRIARHFLVAHTSAAWIQAAAALRRKAREQGRRPRLADSWIAAWAIVHDTYVVTRNVKAFEALGVKAKSW